MHRIRRTAAALGAAIALTGGSLAHSATAAEPHDPVVLVHGYSGTPSNWDAVRQALLAAG